MIAASAAPNKPRKENTRTITLRTPADLSLEVKVAALIQDTSQQDLWFRAMRKYLKHLKTKTRLSDLDLKFQG